MPALSGNKGGSAWDSQLLPGTVLELQDVLPDPATFSRCSRLHGPLWSHAQALPGRVRWMNNDLVATASVLTTAVSTRRWHGVPCDATSLSNAHSQMYPSSSFCLLSAVLTCRSTSFIRSSHSSHKSPIPTTPTFTHHSRHVALRCRRSWTSSSSWV
jgi:hypothetical protein